MKSVASAVSTVVRSLVVKEKAKETEKTNASSSSKSNGTGDSKRADDSQGSGSASTGTSTSEPEPIKDEVVITSDKKDDSSTVPGGHNTTVALTTSKSPGSVTVQLDDKLSAQLHSVLSRIDRASAKFESLLGKISEDYGSEQNAGNLKQLQRYVRTTQRLLGRLNGLDSTLGSDLGSKLSALLSRASQILQKNQGFLTGARQHSFHFGSSFGQESGLGNFLNLSA